MAASFQSISFCDVAPNRPDQLEEWPSWPHFTFESVAAEDVGVKWNFAADQSRFGGMNVFDSVCEHMSS